MNDKVSVSASAAQQRGASMVAPRVRLDRRKLLRGGAGAAPVLMTLASNPVSAASSCVVASSFVSVATFKSRNPRTSTISCANRTVEGWRSAVLANPTMACAQPLVSASCFGGTTCTYNARTLGWVICQPTAYSGELGVLQHLIALHLSVTQGFMNAPAGGISASYLSSVWVNFKSTGGYRLPASGINWTSAQLVTWLRYQLGYSLPV